jgi:hypothetical protein
MTTTTTTTTITTKEKPMKVKSLFCSAVLAFSLALVSWPVSAQTSSSPTDPQSSANPEVDSIPIDKLVTATCRQAWQMAGRNQDGFYAIVARLTELSAHNRGVSIPDDQQAGARAGEWIRTQALKDPDQLLYSVVDRAVQYSIGKGRTTPANDSTTSQR